ncbi:hypothetical protein [Microbispora sp. KK1-11]|uniref:hypothetical protein n=1 Tax=Microbispora sp. KK1-11 TaxID=2053005 RepID=UPI00115ABD4C|nr:hypothetical protein [Microbispora sp. KK1-11]TQS27192.1 hypothetical protein FLW16_20880 [Microbispora sp. KK1-11]
MTLDWCVEVALLGLLTVSTWPPHRTGPIRRQPRLLSDVAEAEFDQHTRLYVLTHVRAEGATTTPLVADWDQITAYAARCSDEIDTLYVCVVHGVQKWYWQWGLMTDAPADATGGRRDRRPRHVKPYGCRRRLDAALEELTKRRTPPVCRFRRRPGTIG